MMYPVVIVGAGILGTTLAYWLSYFYNGEDVVVLEQEQGPAQHTSGRNTGVIHRPFYLHPQRKRMFAKSAQRSYAFWKQYAAAHHLPFVEVGTMEVAVTEEDLEALRRYKGWAGENGMDPEETVLYAAQEVKTIEPALEVRGALLCRTDASVDFGAFTRSLAAQAQKRGVTFRFGTQVERIEQRADYSSLVMCDGTMLRVQYLINCAGGNALRLARMMGFDRRYWQLNVRGEYWVVDDRIKDLVHHNIYSVPRHHAFPFLDPHWVVRWNGAREIGPNAVPVFGPYSYRGARSSIHEGWRALRQVSSLGALRLLGNREFLSLAAEEWRSSLFKSAMVRRIQRFLPSLRVEHLLSRGAPGIRGAIIGPEGQLEPEAILWSGQRSFHILNFNSPGATGAPAFTLWLLQQLSRNLPEGWKPRRPFFVEPLNAGSV